MIGALLLSIAQLLFGIVVVTTLVLALIAVFGRR